MSPKLDSLEPQQDINSANLADDYPSPEREPQSGLMDMSSELANQATAQAIAEAVARHSEELPDVSGVEDTAHEQTSAVDSTSVDLEQPTLRAESVTRKPDSGSSYANYVPHNPSRLAATMSNSDQIHILRDFYTRNPTPSVEDLHMLAEKTGRDWTKIRQYFRQRRHKLRGLRDMESMQEPGRATGWLQVTYRSAPSSLYVSQLALYNSYKTRFDPYCTTSPLLGGQELIQLACATFPGCEMAKEDDDYVLKGMSAKESDAVETTSEMSEIGIDNLVEPLRAGTWILGNFHHQPDSTASVTQAELYASYASRFSVIPGDQSKNDETAKGHNDMADPSEAELEEYEMNMTSSHKDMDDINSINLALEGRPDGQLEKQGSSSSQDKPPRRSERLLNPVELINLARMTFPKCEPVVDEQGRFIIKGLERRGGVEKGIVKVGDMFPFALASDDRGTSADGNPLATLLKRKLATLYPEEPGSSKQAKLGDKDSGDSNLTAEEKELLGGLKRFKSSALGKEVRNICVNQ